MFPIVMLLEDKEHVEKRYERKNDTAHNEVADAELVVEA